MKSITLTVGYIITVLMIHVSATDYVLLNEAEGIRRDSPFNFIYYAPDNNYLLMEITIVNIPPNVTEIYLKHNNYGKTGNSQREAVNIENNIGKIMIWGRLIFNEVSLEVELRTKTGLCANKRVADGKNWRSWKFIESEEGLAYLDNSRRHYDNSGTCLAPYNCNIVMDFKNKCEEFLKCYLRASQFICTIQNAKTPYNLYQTYDDDSTIGNTMSIRNPNLKLNIALELFDVNTTVNVAGKNITGFKKIMAGNSIKDYNATTLKYFETTEVMFECVEDENYRGQVVYVNVGVINTNNKIETFKTSVIQKKLNLADNGTILCCLYYVQKANWAKEVTLTRFVVNKTILIYQQNASIENVANQSTEHADDSSWLLYVFVTLIGVSTLMVAFCIISKKCWFKESQPVQESVESDYQAHQNQVLYADINFVNNACRPQDQTEESHYARIIGELHPL